MIVPAKPLEDQLDRLQDLYLMGDLTKGQYVMRRQALEEEVQRIGPPIDPDIAQAEALLDDFARASGRSRTPPPSATSSSANCSTASGKTAARS
jgi:septation ring formation regulator EzrA